MRLLSLINFLLVVLICSGWGQSSFNPDVLNDVYGIQVKINERILLDDCDCCSGQESKNDKCVLYKIDILDVFLHRDSTVYNTELEIEKNAQYLIIPDNIEMNGNNDRIIVFAHNSCYEEILTANQILYELPEDMPSYKRIPFFSGLIKCYKFNFWQRIMLKLNIKTEKIMAKAKKAPLNDSHFVQEILLSRSK